MATDAHVYSIPVDGDKGGEEVEVGLDVVLLDVLFVGRGSFLNAFGGVLGALRTHTVIHEPKKGRLDHLYPTRMNVNTHRNVTTPGV